MGFFSFSSQDDKNLDPSLGIAMTPWMMNGSLHLFRLLVFIDGGN